MKNKLILLLLLFNIVMFSTQVPVRVDDGWLLDTATGPGFSSEFNRGLYGAEEACFINPPLYYLLLRPFVSVLGFDVSGLRVLGLALAYISVLITYSLGGIVPAIMLGTSPIFLVAASTLRPDITAGLLLLVAYVLYRRKNWLSDVLTGVFVGLMLLTSLTGIFGFIFFFLMYLIDNRKNMLLFVVSFLMCIR